MFVETINQVLDDPAAALRKSWNLFNTALIGSASLFGTYDPVSSQELRTTSAFPSGINLLTATIQDLQACLQNGSVTSVQLTKEYLVGPLVNSPFSNADMCQRLALS